MHENVEMRRSDALLLSFFSGTILAIFFVMLGAIFIPSED
jgi:RsiW-degrading membrane proteinase PrsW (M82 family)